MLEKKFPQNQSKSDLISHLLVWVLFRVAGWICICICICIAPAKLIIEHLGFVFIASVGEEMCEKLSKILWRGDGE